MERVRPRQRKNRQFKNPSRSSNKNQCRRNLRNRKLPLRNINHRCCHQHHPRTLEILIPIKRAKTKIREAMVTMAAVALAETMAAAVVATAEDIDCRKKSQRSLRYKFYHARFLGTLALVLVENLFAKAK